MMKKFFTLWAACALPMIAPLDAHEGGEEIAKIQKDRERLIDLVLNLESDFGKTLEDYGKLQAAYAKLLNRPVVKDHSAKVKELQKQLTAASAKLQAQEMTKADADARALLEKDLVNLRNELHRERQDLLVAKASLLRVKQLEAKSKTLEDSLKKETKERATMMGQLQAIRGERDALLGKIEGLMARAEKAEKGHREANVRIGELEKETNTLKLKVQGQDVELRKLRVEQAHNKGAMAAAAGMRKEQNRLKALLETREKELNDLRADLAVEMKRSLDVPVLIKARDELQKKLTASATNADGLKKKNTALTKKQSELQKEIEMVQKSITAMQAELAKNKTAMAKVTELGAKNRTLITERDQLSQTIAMAKEELVKSRSVLQTTEAKLAESLKKSKKADEFQKQNNDLLAQLEVHKTQVASAKVDMSAMKKTVAQNQTAMKTAVALGQKVEVLTAERELLNSKLEEMKSTHLEAEAKLKAAKASLMKKSEMSDEAKKAMAESEKLRKSLATSQTALKDAEKKAAQAARLKKDYDALTASAAALEKQKMTLSDEVSKRDADLKKMQAEMAKKPDMTEDLAKLQKEKEQLAAQAARFKKDYDALTSSAAALEKQKMTLSDEIAKRDADLKKMRAEMAAKPDMTADLAKLQKEKDKLAADLKKRETDLNTTRGELGRLQLSASVAKKQLNAMKRETAVIEDVRYAKGEADVTAQQARVLTQVQNVLKLFPEARFEIVGHTCDLGSAEGNLRLSQERAKALLDFLVEKGIEADRLKSRGVGIADPVVPNTSEENRRKNRRVVVEILD